MKEIIYSLKIINPNNAGGEFLIDKLELQKKQYSSVKVLKEEIVGKIVQYVNGLDTQFGFISPGHGMKGKQERIDVDQDLEVMYNVHQKKKRIFLWIKCKPASKKRSNPESASSNAPQSKRQNSLVTTMSEVEDIASKLKEKHGEKFTSLQLNCWAHMIHTNKYDSFDIAPDKPFFGKKRRDSVGVSPGKRISLRSECINQLDKWHQLKERGVIGSDQYEELQQTILTDIKKF